jgi:Uma2 family endonuclease
MVAMITDPALEDELISRRRRTGADRYDEIWDGIYVMTPLADDEHQALVSGFTAVLHVAVEWAGLGRVRPGVNVTDREDDWKQNYRCPDVVVFTNETRAENRGTHWLGGPDFVVEIVSPHDRSREKLAFYAAIGVRELLLVDRGPWTLELYRLEGSTLKLVVKSEPGDGCVLNSHILPLQWRFLADKQRPRIEAAHTDGAQKWTI